MDIELLPCQCCGQLRPRKHYKPSHYVKRKYCSIECAGKGRGLQQRGPNNPWYQGGKETRACKICGSEFQADRTYRKSTCSKTCDSKRRSISQLGELSHRWQGGKTAETKRFRNSALYREWRKEVYERDNYTCQICFKRGGKLTAHHIIPFNLRTDLALLPQNGITLCWPCHLPLKAQELKVFGELMAYTHRGNHARAICRKAIRAAGFVVAGEAFEERATID